MDAEEAMTILHHQEHELGGREMSIEYHGWVVLATCQDDWSDDDFESGYDQVAQAAASLPRDAGHEAVLPDCEVLPRVLYLKGNQVESLDPVLRAMEQVGALFDRAYGELTVFEEGSLSSRWDSSALTRYFLTDGKLTNGKSGTENGHVGVRSSRQGCDPAGE